MSQTSTKRAARRVAAIRQRIIDSDDENVDPAQSNLEEADEFKVAPETAFDKPMKRQSRRTVEKTPQITVKQEPTSDVEPLEALSNNELPAMGRPSKASRRSVRESRKSVRPTDEACSTVLTTSELSEAFSACVPDTTSKDGIRPVPDALSSAQATSNDEIVIVEETEAASTASLKEVRSNDDMHRQISAKQVLQPSFETTMERPMDIVIRSRAKGISIGQGIAEAKPRTIITYLILNNFKSYAGRQEVGPFHASFSSVVGPNGSGKSNVIDSLLFVFGFRASKMRQGKVSALIHNSAAHPDLDHCEVQVHFQEVLDQPCGRSEPIPNSDLVISRKAFRNNSSKYYLNGSESSFTIVTSLLRDRGVDLDHKRFLILQGEVESIAQMKPKASNEHDDGLLEYLEDIIGTSKYKTPIEEASAETENLNEICTEKNRRVQHVEKEKGALESKKDAALAFVRDENELATKQASLYQIYINDCEGNIQVTGEAAQLLQSQLDQEVTKHRGGEDEIRELEKRHKSDSKDFERLEQNTKAVLKQQEKLARENVKFEEKKKHMNTKVKKLEKTIGSSRSALSEANAYVERLTEDVKLNASSIDEINESLQVEENELARIRDTLKGKTQGLSDEISMKQKSLEPWLEQINEKQSAIALAQSELAMLTERDNAGALAIIAAEGRLKELKDEVSKKIVELEALNSQKMEFKSKLMRIEKTLDEISTKEPVVKAKLSSARQKADEARASLSHSQTQGNVLAGLTRLKESGRIKGFHGRLGDLGIIDQKYDVAISTACPQLDNLVVDSVEVGQQCIEYLRKNNLGRANFILLDRLATRDLSKIDTPENVSRLFDLVRPKEELFRQALFSVLQNTLVAKDLDQANRIAYGTKRWRVVTLDGQLIDKSGTMSGGGSKTAKGLMSAKLQEETTKEQVAKLESDLIGLEQQWKDLHSTQEASADEHRQINNSIPGVETAIQKCSLAVESLTRNVIDAETRCSELRGRDMHKDKADLSRMNSLHRAIGQNNEDITRLQKESSGLETEINILQDKIMEIGGVQLRSQKAKVDGLREQIETLTEEMSNAEVTKARTEKQQKKHKKTEEDASLELRGMSDALEQLDDEIQKQARETSGSRREAEEAHEHLVSKKEELAALKAEIDRRTAELNDARGVEIEMRNKLEEDQKVLNENKKRLKYWQEKYSKLQLQNTSELGEEQGEQSLPTYTRDELQDLDKEMLKGEIAILEEKMQNINVDLAVLEEYRRRVEEHAARTTDLTEAVTNRDAAKRRCEELRKLRLEGFMEGFSAISLRLKEMYQMITMGGNAELELVDSLDPFSEGILFSVMPPKKSWKNISNLSGGEKTLSSLALVFALHHYKPTPLYVMDEIDAALDFRNVSIVASYIKERTKNAQFIVISLRNNMFELASRLVGVYKVNHMTKSVTVENRDFIDRAP